MAINLRKGFTHTFSRLLRRHLQQHWYTSCYKFKLFDEELRVILAHLGTCYSSRIKNIIIKNIETFQNKLNKNKFRTPVYQRSAALSCTCLHASLPAIYVRSWALCLRLPLGCGIESSIDARESGLHWTRYRFCVNSLWKWSITRRDARTRAKLNHTGMYSLLQRVVNKGGLSPPADLCGRG